MARPQRSNWIGGTACAAVSGAWFEFDAHSRWPRSDARDVTLAAQWAVAAAPAWARLRAEERRERVLAALERLRSGSHSSAASGADWPSALGLDARTLAPAIDSALEAARGACSRARRESFHSLAASREGAAGLATEWSELCDPLVSIAFALARGRTLVVVPDGRLPQLADLWCEAFADLPAGVFNLLHDDTRGALRALLGNTSLASVEAHLACESERASESTHTEPADAARAPLELVPLACASRVVSARGDPASAARAVLADALGRASALSGARPGAIGRVLVPTRIFSRFSEEFLSALDALLEHEPPLALATHAAKPALERAVALGHDEGATAIRVGESRQHGSWPVVFTNVEERMRLARLARPLGLVRLMRVPDERAGFALAARLDRAQA